MDIEDKDRYLTLGEVRALRTGDQLDVVVWDNNTRELSVKNRCTLTYIGNMKWNITFSNGETHEHSIHLDVSTYHEYLNWAPVSKESNGAYKVHVGYCSECNVADPDFTCVALASVDDDVRVGWGGPIILWDEFRAPGS